MSRAIKTITARTAALLLYADVSLPSASPAEVGFCRVRTAMPPQLPSISDYGAARSIVSPTPAVGASSTGPFVIHEVSAKADCGKLHFPTLSGLFGQEMRNVVSRGQAYELLCRAELAGNDSASSCRLLGTSSFSVIQRSSLPKRLQPPLAWCPSASSRIEVRTSEPGCDYEFDAFGSPDGSAEDPPCRSIIAETAA